MMGVATVGTAEAGGHQADGLIRKAGKPNFKGNNNYGAGQTVTFKRAPGQTARFDIACQSDGESGDLTASIGATAPPFTRLVFLGKTNLTTEVTDGDGIRMDDVNLNKMVVFSYRVKVSPSATPGATDNGLFICGDGIAGPSGDDPNVIAKVEVV